MRVQMSQPNPRTYRLTIRDDRNKTWTVDHTYTDFCKLRQHLAMTVPPKMNVPPVPPKRYRHNSATLEERRMAFTYLVDWVLATNLLADPKVAEFFDVNEADVAEVARLHAASLDTNKTVTYVTPAAVDATSPVQGESSSSSMDGTVKEKRRKLRWIVLASAVLVILVWWLSSSSSSAMESRVMVQEEANYTSTTAQVKEHEEAVAAPGEENPTIVITIDSADVENTEQQQENRDTPDEEKPTIVITIESSDLEKADEQPEITTTTTATNTTTKVVDTVPTTSTEMNTTTTSPIIEKITEILHNSTGKNTASSSEQQPSFPATESSNTAFVLVIATMCLVSGWAYLSNSASSLSSSHQHHQQQNSTTVRSKAPNTRVTTLPSSSTNGESTSTNRGTTSTPRSALQFEQALLWVDENDEFLSDQASARIRAYAWRATGFEALAPSKDDPLHEEMMSLRSNEEAREMFLLYVEALQMKTPNATRTPQQQQQASGSSISSNRISPSTPIHAGDNSKTNAAAAAAAVNESSFETTSVSAESTPQNSRQALSTTPPTMSITKTVSSSENKLTTSDMLVDCPPADNMPPGNWSNSVPTVAVLVGLGVLAAASNPNVRRRVQNMIVGG